MFRVSIFSHTSVLFYTAHNKIPPPPQFPLYYISKKICVETPLSQSHILRHPLNYDILKR